MFSIGNSIVMMLSVTIAFLSFCQLIVVCGQDFFGLGMNPNPLESFDINSLLFMNNNLLSGDLTNRLNDFCPGNTVSFEDLANIVMSSGMNDDDNEYNLQFDNRISDLYESQLLVGQLKNVDQITTVTLSFYNGDGDAVLDSNGSPIQYTSTRQDLGHVLDILRGKFSFSYARCRLRLKPNSIFDPQSLFFHFSQPRPTSASKQNITYRITGPTSFSIDSPQQSYNVSENCPYLFNCMWILNNVIINRTSSSSVTLTFKRRDVGNRILSYVAHHANIPQILASLPISILPSAQPANTTYIMVGPSNFSIDSPVQSYNVSGNCPYLLTCMWLLDNTVINGTFKNSAILNFTKTEVGNRTLFYVGYYSNDRWILASLPILISSNSTAG